MGGKDVENGRFDPDVVTFPWMQEQPMWLKGNRCREQVLGDVADIETLHGCAFPLSPQVSTITNMHVRHTHILAANRAPIHNASDPGRLV